MASGRRSLMSLQERLRTIAEALPEGASITLSSEALRSLLETDADESSTLATRYDSGRGCHAPIACSTNRAPVDQGT